MWNIGEKEQVCVSCKPQIITNPYDPHKREENNEQNEVIGQKESVTPLIPSMLTEKEDDSLEDFFNENSDAESQNEERNKPAVKSFMTDKNSFDVSFFKKVICSSTAAI